jgi:hypothetical protein
MVSPHPSSRRPVALLLVIAASTIALTAAGRQARGTPTPRRPASCATGEFRQFDFFAGDWDTYDVADPSKVADGPDRTGSHGGRHAVSIARHLVEGRGGGAREGGAFDGWWQDVDASVRYRLSAAPPAA